MMMRDVFVINFFLFGLDRLLFSHQKCSRVLGLVFLFVDSLGNIQFSSSGIFVLSSYTVYIIIIILYETRNDLSPLLKTFFHIIHTLTGLTVTHIIMYTHRIANILHALSLYSPRTERAFI